MSYDIYCYKSKLGRPDEEEADAVIETDTNKWAKKDTDASTKLAIVKALIQFNPQLEAVDFHYGDIAKLTITVMEKEKSKFNRIELNSKHGETYVQLSVHDNHVFITVPFGYHGEQAKQLFEDMKSYISIIRQTAGYFVSDPQTGKVFDPAENSFDGLNKYLFVSNGLFKK